MYGSFTVNQQRGEQTVKGHFINNLHTTVYILKCRLTQREQFHNCSNLDPEISQPELQKENKENKNIGNILSLFLCFWPEEVN